MSRPEQQELAAFFGLTDKEVVAEFQELCASGVNTISAELDKTR